MVSMYIAVQFNQYCNASLNVIYKLLSDHNNENNFL